MKKRTVIVTGLAATFPVGGVFWDYLQYLQGFCRLGHDAYYLEDTGMWVYSPVENTFVADMTANAEYLAGHLERLGEGLEKRFCLRGADDRHYGMTREAWADVVKRADVFINVSTTCQLREEYAKIPVKVLIDSDPLYTQTGVPGYLDGTADQATREAVDRLRAHDVFFSFGENVGKPGCAVPPELFDWKPTRQPVVLDAWSPSPPPSRQAFTTVLSWQPVQEGPLVRGVRYGGKNFEFEKLIDLPKRTDAVLELALGGGKPPREWLADCGWQLVDGYAKSSDPWKYRDYLWEGMAEFSTAKNAYVATRSGWFSCRSACYLASGRPVVVQDTGFTDFLPTGQGVLAFTTEDEALEGIGRVRADWPCHSEAARRFAAEHFDSAKVLSRLLAEALG
jgi:hypothetical protein